MMMGEICGHIHNWFTAEKDRHAGTYAIEGGTLVLPFLSEGQYFRIVGSALNDGVYKYTTEKKDEAQAAAGEDTGESGEDTGESGENTGEGGETSEASGTSEATGTTEGTESAGMGLVDEVFEGEIWAMKVPREFVLLAGEIEAWENKYGAVMASPYQSENVIGVYSYTKASGSGGSGGATGAGWESAYRSRLNRWRKLR